jgi:hypothetical protein
MAAGSVPEVEAEQHEEGLGVMAEVWTATAEEGHEEEELLAGNGLGRDSSITPSNHGVSGGCRPAHASPPLPEPNVSEG